MTWEAGWQSDSQTARGGAVQKTGTGGGGEESKWQAVKAQRVVLKMMNVLREQQWRTMGVGNVIGSLCSSRQFQAKIDYKSYR